MKTIETMDEHTKHPGEASEWLLGVERDGRVLYLDVAGKSHRVGSAFDGEFLSAYREALRRMRAWIELSGRRDYTVYVNNPVP